MTFTYFVLQDHEKTKTSICTFLSVLVHLNILLPKLDEKVHEHVYTISLLSVKSKLVILSFCGFFSQPVHWRRAVEVILQWCFSHNFSVRLYALLALKRVWELKDANVLSEENLGGLSTVVQACLNQAEAMQNTG